MRSTSANKLPTSYFNCEQLTTNFKLVSLILSDLPLRDHAEIGLDAANVDFGAEGLAQLGGSV